MKLEKQQLYFLMTWVALLGYAPSVLAAELLLGPGDIPVVKYLHVIWMASWGAAAAFLQKYAAGEVVKNWKIVAWKDIVNANLAAVLVFLICRHYQVPSAIESVFYTLAGYGGSRTLETLYRKYISGGVAPEPKQDVQEPQ